MKIIRNFIPPAESTPFNPAKNVVVPAGGSNEITMSGMGGESFGVNRILPFASDMDSILVSARLNEDLYLFREVQLSTVHELFRSIDSLLAPFIIQKNNTLVFELTNTGASEQTVNIELIGYDHFALSKLHRAYQDLGVAMPQPRFLYGQDSVPAGRVNLDLGVKSKSSDVEVRRMAMSSSLDSVVTTSLKVYNTTVRSEIFIEQLNTEFDRSYANVPFIVGAMVPFNVTASNHHATESAVVSFLAEAYVAQKDQPISAEA